ncbi:MAG: CdaR family protein [Kiritimatiellaeota bacterium]|nr:CdaR family protein [Kiritimatiellota bacterium]
MAELLKRLAHAATNNRGLKLAAFLAALIAWYAIRATISHETLIKDVPLAILVGEGWVAMHGKIKTVEVLFRGAQEDLRRLDRSQIRLDVDLRSRKQPGPQRVRLDPRNVQSPGGARPVLVEPAEITVTLDQEGEKRVPVKAEFQGNLLQDHEVTQTVCEPATVLLYGPRRQLDHLNMVHTTPIDLEGRSRSFRKTYAGLALAGETRMARDGASNVTVTVTIEERSVLKTFQSMPVHALLAPNSRAPVDLAPVSVNLTLRGRAELLNALNREALRVYVDCAGLAPGTETNLPARVFVPAGIEVSAMEPASLRVTVGGGRSRGT